MASIFRGISSPVGIRNGLTMLPNTPADLAVITDLFDRIPTLQGGTEQTAGNWKTDRNALIPEVTAQIFAFQTINKRPKIDSAIDPNGGSIKLMNQLARDPSGPTPSGGISASVVAAPDGRSEASGATGYFVADVNSLSGTAPLKKTVIAVDYVRRLVRVEGCSVKWFGVVLPAGGPSDIMNRKPHLNFTPTPNQGGYQDATYETFGGWGKLWDDYTHIIGSQIVGAGVAQVLVLPIYKTSQSRSLGDFLSSWEEVVSKVVTAAVDSIDPMALRDTYTFDRIVSSSFSNGYVAHQHFNTSAVGAGAKTDVLFDLDGVAGRSTWRPANGVIYLNRPAGLTNPQGTHYYVGGRWSDFTSIYPGGVNSHAASRNHLLHHGVWSFCE